MGRCQTVFCANATIMTDLNELQIFVQVAQTHSFTLAAKRLGVPKSAASRGLARLEQRLGVRLLQRTTRRVTLTDGGEVYLQHCQRVLEEAEQADLAVSALQAAPRGWLRVGAPLTFARFFLGELLEPFLARYPELRVHILLRGTDITQPEDNLDVLIQAGPLEDSRMVVKRLGFGRRGIYASSTYVEKQGMPDSPIGLRQHSCITTGETGASATWRIRRGSDIEEIQLSPRVSVADPSIHHQLALSGVGIAILPQNLVREDQKAGRLVRVLSAWEPEPVELYAVYPSRLNQTPKLRVFLQWLEENRGMRFK
jgi:DNA-binding transcriptional LysR family regulator